MVEHGTMTVLVSPLAVGHKLAQLNEITSFVVPRPDPFTDRVLEGGLQQGPSVVAPYLRIRISMVKALERVGVCGRPNDTTTDLFRAVVRSSRGLV